MIKFSLPYFETVSDFGLNIFFDQIHSSNLSSEAASQLLHDESMETCGAERAQLTVLCMCLRFVPLLRPHQDEKLSLHHIFV